MTYQTQKPRPICNMCGIYPCKTNGYTKLGMVKYRKRCTSCDKAKYEKKLSYKAHKKPQCGLCGFVAVDPCQLDVDHIDGNHKNNDPSNLQTLCANCHRLKSLQDSRSRSPLRVI